MACPTIEDVTRELVRRIQVHFDGANVFASGGVTSIEVVEDSGAPVLEVQDQPQIAVTGPSLRAVSRFGVDPRQRVLVSTDENTGTGVTAPAPLLRDADYQLVCTALRDSTSQSGQPGIQWLEMAVSLWGQTGGADGPMLLGDGWTGDEAVGAFQGYLFEMTRDPTPMASNGNQRGFSCTVTVRNVRITDGTQATVPLTEEIELSTDLIP